MGYSDIPKTAPLLTTPLRFLARPEFGRSDITRTETTGPGRICAGPSAWKCPGAGIKSRGRVRTESGKRAAGCPAIVISRKLHHFWEHGAGALINADIETYGPLGLRLESQGLVLAPRLRQSGKTASIGPKGLERQRMRSGKQSPSQGRGLNYSHVLLADAYGPDGSRMRRRTGTASSVSRGVDRGAIIEAPNCYRHANARP